MCFLRERKDWKAYLKSGERLYKDPIQFSATHKVTQITFMKKDFSLTRTVCGGVSLLLSPFYFSSTLSPCLSYLDFCEFSQFKKFTAVYVSHKC